MIVLLPPSESKATRPRGAQLDLGRLSLPELTSARSQVIAHLREVSARPDAPSLLGVSPNLTDEIARNTRLTTAATLPASALYTGVLYDALDLPTLTGPDKSRATRRIIISSALYGAVRLTDRLAPYRLSMSVNLPPLGPLAGFWKTRLAQPLARVVGDGLVVDCRSSTYAASWMPPPHDMDAMVHVRVPGATHMAKHTRGLFTRYLVTMPEKPSTARELAEMAGEGFDVKLTEPSGSRRPWVLDVTAR